MYSQVSTTYQLQDPLACTNIKPIVGALLEKTKFLAQRSYKRLDALLVESINNNFITHLKLSLQNCDWFQPVPIKGRNLSTADNFCWATIPIIPTIRLINWELANYQNYRQPDKLQSLVPIAQGNQRKIDILILLVN